MARRAPDARGDLTYVETPHSIRFMYPPLRNSHKLLIRSSPPQALRLETEWSSFMRYLLDILTGAANGGTPGPGLACRIIDGIVDGFDLGSTGDCRYLTAFPSGRLGCTGERKVKNKRREASNRIHEQRAGLSEFCAGLDAFVMLRALQWTVGTHLDAEGTLAPRGANCPSAEIDWRSEELLQLKACGEL